MENTQYTKRPAQVRNVFVKASASDMGKIDQRTSDNLKQALLAMNVYEGCLKNYPIEEKGFKYSTAVARAGDDTMDGHDSRRRIRRTNDYIRKALNQMGLHGVAKNYLLGDKDQNNAEDNRILESVLNKAIGMVNPYKVTEKNDDEIKNTLDSLNQDYEQETDGLIQKLKDNRVFERMAYLKEDTTTLIGRIRRAFL